MLRDRSDKISTTVCSVVIIVADVAVACANTVHDLLLARAELPFILRE